MPQRLSLSLDPDLAHQLRPFPDFRIDVGSRFLRRLWFHIHVDFFQLLAYIGRVERLVQFGIEPGDDGFGRARRDLCAVPELHGVTRQGVGDGWLPLPIATELNPE